jgi:hypothetical protein
MYINGQIKKQNKMTDYYQEQIERLERQKKQFKNLLFAVVVAAILMSVWGVYKVTFLAGISILSYMSAKQIVSHYCDGLISNLELVLWFVLGFMAFSGISDMIIAMNVQ